MDNYRNSPTISPIVWNMCENLNYESVYFKELHNQQEYYWPTIYRTGAAVVSTITSYIGSYVRKFSCMRLKENLRQYKL